jgi:hypothetical protein
VPLQSDPIVSVTVYARLFNNGGEWLETCELQRTDTGCVFFTFPECSQGHVARIALDYFEEKLANPRVSKLRYERTAPAGGKSPLMWVTDLLVLTTYASGICKRLLSSRVSHFMLPWYENLGRPDERLANYDFELSKALGSLLPENFLYQEVLVTGEWRTNTLKSKRALWFNASGDTLRNAIYEGHLGFFQELSLSERLRIAKAYLIEAQNSLRLASLNQDLDTILWAGQLPDDCRERHAQEMARRKQILQLLTSPDFP